MKLCRHDSSELERKIPLFIIVVTGMYNVVAIASTARTVCVCVCVCAGVSESTDAMRS